MPRWAFVGGIAGGVLIVIFLAVVVLLAVGGGLFAPTTVPQGQRAATATAQAAIKASRTSTPGPTATGVPGTWSATLAGGNMPTPQTAGQRMRLRYEIRNTGRDIPDLTVWFQGLGSWVVTQAYSDCGNGLRPVWLHKVGNGEAWNFGALRHGDRCDPTLELMAKVVGKHTLKTRAYGAEDISSPTVDPSSNLKVDRQWSGEIKAPQ